MKKIFLIGVLILAMSCAKKTNNKQMVELSCGQCQFGMTSQEGCDLAVRIEGETYFVDGADINEFGDAHDENTGFCQVIRKAEIEGVLIEGRFKVSSAELLD